MKHKLGYLLTAALAMVLTTAGVISTKTSGKAIEPTFAGYTNGDGATYYSGISSSATGDTLLSALRSLNSTKRKATVGYSSMGTTPSGQFKYTDYTTDSVKYDSNGQPYGERIVSFYSGNSTTSFNREHVWPNSHGGNVIENDIHMPRPTIASENGSRGNSFYVEGKCSGTSGWDPAMESFGDATYRGDSARIIFYCMLVDTRLSLIEADSHSTSNSNKDYMMGRLSDLIKWNINYPVLDREQRRNEGAEYLQGNRNPFIDHPEYACKIWGSTNSTTQSLCSNATYPNESHSAGIRIDDGYNIASTNTQAYTLAVGDSVNFLPFVDGAYNASVSWNLSDYDVASSAYYGRSTYTNGVTITGVAAGTSTLTLSYSYTDNNETKYATATCLITVTTSGQSGEGGGDASDVTNVTSATYTVATTSTVNNTGTVPSGSSASYSQTFSTKGQITNGKNAVLTLSGYTGKVITGIKLNMKSNGSSGAGSLSVTAGSTSLASTSGTFNTWYDNDSYGTSYRDINVTLTNSSHIIANNETITITITGSTNSLYINSYTITYGDPDNGSGEVEESVLTSITASGMTQSYVVGDAFSFDGVLTAHYSDGNSETVIPDTVSSPNMSTTGNQTITLTYSENEVEKSTTYVIYVSAQAKTLTSISISTAPTKTSYYSGQTFDPTGLVITRTYSDSTSDTYTYANHTSEFTFTPSTSAALTTSNTSVTISYGGKSTSQSITVNEVTLTSIAVSTAPTKLTYVVDECFNPTGLVITRNYSNSTSDTYTYANHTSEFSFNPSLLIGLTIENTSVTITYGGQSTTQAITVSSSGGGGSSEDFSGTYNYSNGPEGTGVWSLSDYEDQNTYLKCPSSGTNSVALIAGIFTDKTISSDVEITINCATFGSGTNPSASTFAIYNSSACTSLVTSSQSGTLPISSTYTNVVYTVTESNAANFNDDLAIKITKPGKQIRLKSIDVSFTYSESGSSETPTSIIASVSKTFYVGETISTSDIIVKDNNNKTVSSFTFANNGYQFTYADAASGGASTSKTFTNAISGANLTCSLTVQVQRKAYAIPSTSTLEHTGSEFSNAGIGSSYATNQTATVDGITFTVDGYIYSSKLSLSSGKTSAPGKVINTTPYPGGITNVTVSGASPDIQLSTDGSTWVDLSSATTSSVNYYYLKLFYKTTTQSNYVNITNFTVSYKGTESATNVANYVMYEDTNNQCETKFSVAKGYFEAMSTSERSTFMKSSDYVISKGRERLLAWAAHEGKTITQVNGDYAVSAPVNIVLENISQNSAGIAIIVTVSLITAASIGGYFFIKKRKEI